MPEDTDAFAELREDAPAASRRLPAGPPRPLGTAPTRPEVRRTLVVALGFVALGLALYLPGIAHPVTVTFDEIHYVTVARHYERGEFINASYGDRMLPYNYEHPPLAKYAMWASVEVLGDNAWGWRLPATLVAASGLAAAYVLARRLFDSEAAGVAAGLLLALDNLYYLHAGMAMLEAWPAALTTWSFALALGGTGERRASPIVFGAAVATKYNAVFLMPVFLLVHWLRLGDANRYVKTAKAVGLGVAAPLGVLVFTYLPYFLIWGEQGGLGFAVQNWFLVQIAALSWDFGADATHDYASGPLSWILLERPVHYYAVHETTRVAHIYSLGNPVLWWPGFVAAVAAALVVPVRFAMRHGRALLGAEFWNHWSDLRVSWDAGSRFFLAGLLMLFSWAPFFLLQRVTFMYYMTSVVPFFALVMGGAVAWAWRRGDRYQIAAVAYVGLAAVAFVFYFPVSEGLLVPRAWMDAIFGSVPGMRR